MIRNLISSLWGLTGSEKDIARNEVNAIFHFINALHEKTSFVITTNKSPKEWVETIRNEVITTLY